MNKEKKYSFPGFRCPNPVCGAKNVAFAANRHIYNNSKIMLVADRSNGVSAEYIVICPKCKSYLAIWDQTMITMPTLAEK